MLPLMLELARLRLVLTGEGAPALRRLRLLEEAGATTLDIYAADPTPDFAAAAGARLRRRWPEPAELAAAQIVFIADGPEAIRVELAERARQLGALIHVEDAPLLSNVQAPAVLRRGALTLAISTGGASPGLAVEIKRFLAGIFGPEWSGRLDEMAALRQRWRESGALPDTVRRWTGAWIGRRGWFSGRPLPRDNNNRR